MKKLAYLLFFVSLTSLFTACTDNCENIECLNGECIDGICDCDEGFTGSDCSLAISGSTITGTISNDLTLEGNTIYNLSGKIVVENGATLTIGAGAILKAAQGTETDATALIITRDAKIMAMGTASNPIIFTSVLDDIEVGQITGSNLNENDRQKWGGLIILGNAPISAGDGDTEANIEGLPAAEGYGKYGGSNTEDNSGVLEYVSVRHGGVLIGEGNEINGITLGGVGSGTTINHVEVIGNLDDGIECFGGTVNIDNAIVAFQGDDAIDIDQNYAGTIDNFLIIHGGDTDMALEIDGIEGTTYTDGKFTLTNGTIINTNQSGGGADLKDKAQGTIINTTFAGYSPASNFIEVSKGFDADNNCADKLDAYDKILSGDLSFNNVEIIALGLTVENCINAYTKVEACEANIDQAALDAAITGVNIVGAASTGANTTEFTGWTWTDANNKL